MDTNVEIKDELLIQDLMPFENHLSKYKDKSSKGTIYEISLEAYNTVRKIYPSSEEDFLKFLISTCDRLPNVNKVITLRYLDNDCDGYSFTEELKNIIFEYEKKYLLEEPIPVIPYLQRLFDIYPVAKRFRLIFESVLSILSGGLYHRFSGLINDVGREKFRIMPPLLSLSARILEVYDGFSKEGGVEFRESVPKFSAYIRNLEKGHGIHFTELLRNLNAVGSIGVEEITWEYLKSKSLVGESLFHYLYTILENRKLLYNEGLQFLPETVTQNIKWINSLSGGEKVIVTNLVELLDPTLYIEYEKSKDNLHSNEGRINLNLKRGDQLQIKSDKETSLNLNETTSSSFNIVGDTTYHEIEIKVGEYTQTIKIPRTFREETIQIQANSKVELKEV